MRTMETGFIYATGAAITWGLVYAIDQKILANVDPLTLLFIDSIIVAIIMLPLVFLSNGSIRDVLVSVKGNLTLIAVSVALATLSSFFIFSAIKSLGAATASIIEIAYPFFVVLFSYVLFRYTPNIYFFIGGTLVFIGSIIIIKFA
ncbi:MAG: EamA family transporter [Candidatus Aenigmarchaeota archaeon]|nr:EamA family transporter [Candidatus Aenigmarchaeota archaeon]